MIVYCLAPTPVRLHIVDMTENGRTVLRRILQEAPGSMRELARAAGVDVSLLLRIRDGERNLTPDTARAVVAALRGWGKRCLDLADALEATTQTEADGGEDG